jgi:hypothetical protein
VYLIPAYAGLIAPTRLVFCGESLLIGIVPGIGPIGAAASTRSARAHSDRELKGLR